MGVQSPGYPARRPHSGPLRLQIVSKRPGAGLDTTGFYSGRKPLGATRRPKKPFLGGIPLVKAHCHPGLLMSGQRPACKCPGHVRTYFSGAGVLIGAEVQGNKGLEITMLGGYCGHFILGKM